MLNKQGFSLIELLLSISLFLLIIGIASYNFHFLNKFILKSEIDLLYAHCMYIRQSAIVENKDIALSLNIKNNSYSYNNKIYILPSLVTFGFPDNSYGPPSKPNKNLFLPITFKNNQVYFYSNGIISSGVIYLTDNNKQFLYALSNGVSKYSFLRKYFYDGTWKKY